MSHFIYCYAECCYSECHILFIVMLSVIMLSDIMLSVVMLSVIMLSVLVPRFHYLPATNTLAYYDTTPKRFIVLAKGNLTWRKRKGAPNPIIQ
jgi:hypothetical protein